MQSLDATELWATLLLLFFTKQVELLKSSTILPLQFSKVIFSHSLHPEPQCPTAMYSGGFGTKQE